MFDPPIILTGTRGGWQPNTSCAVCKQDLIDQQMCFKLNKLHSSAKNEANMLKKEETYILDTYHF